MLIRDVMNRRAPRLSANATMQLAAELLVLTQVSDVAVVDDENNFAGVVSEGDLIRHVMPHTEEAVSSGATHDDLYRLFLESGRRMAGAPIRALIISDPITLSPDDELLKAATVMITRNIRRLPVVDKGKFMGTASRSDICWGLLCLDQGIENAGVAAPDEG